MEIVVGQSALLLTRVIRSHSNRGNAIKEPLVDLPQIQLSFPAGADVLSTKSLATFHSTLCVEQLSSNSELATLSGSTLEDSGFDFETVSPLAKTDLSRFIDRCAIDAEHPLELGVFNQNQRYQRTKSRTITLSRRLPTQAIFPIDPSLAISSPELSIMQLTSQLDIVELALVIMELCGRYSLHPERDGSLRAEQSFVTCDYPATTCARIAAFIKATNMRRYRHKLEAALTYCTDNSASPMETALTLTLTLPEELGGYGLPRPVLNPKISIPDDARLYVGRNNFHPDLYYPQWLCDLEYESSGFHFDPLQAGIATDQIDRWRKREISHQAADRRRSRDIQALGIKVIPVLSNDFLSAQRMDQVVWALERQAQKFTNNTAKLFKTADTRELREVRTKLLERLSLVGSRHAAF
ncbi:hypothetical protein [Olegusella massiliensis]|uniref:hypothetical protein n=1 Tax=Olegusella massiliensis TaxID=1776381 RepID=UPI000839713F|nr:hypothetical protein [Olegusella massiliensis]